MLLFHISLLLPPKYIVIGFKMTKVDIIGLNIFYYYQRRHCSRMFMVLTLNITLTSTTHKQIRSYLNGALVINRFLTHELYSNTVSMSWCIVQDLFVCCYYGIKYFCTSLALCFHSFYIILLQIFIVYAIVIAILCWSLILFFLNSEQVNK